MPVPLHVRAYGPPDTFVPTVVLLPGGGVGGWSWEPVALALQPDFHVLVPDLPEQGETTLEEAGPFSISAAAAYVEALIAERAHRQRASVAGLSLGGQTAVQLLATTPEIVQRAVLCGTLTRPVGGMIVLDWMLRAYAPFKHLPVLIEANRRALGIPAEFAEPFARDSRRVSTDALRRITAQNMAFRPPDTLRGLAVPTLVLVGAGERGVVRASARDLVELIGSRATARVVPDGHNWPLARPDLFAVTLRAFLLDQALPPELRPL